MKMGKSYSSRKLLTMAATWRTPMNCRSPSDVPTMTGAFKSRAASKTAFNVIRSEILKWPIATRFVSACWSTLRSVSIWSSSSIRLRRKLSPTTAYTLGVIHGSREGSLGSAFWLAYAKDRCNDRICWRNQALYVPRHLPRNSARLLTTSLQCAKPQLGMSSRRLKGECVPVKAAMVITKSERYREILATLARHGIGVVDDEFIKHEAGDRARAEHLRRACEELGTMFVKLGQMLSTLGDPLPEAYRTELAILTTGRFEIERNGEVAYLEYTLWPEIFWS